MQSRVIIASSKFTTPQEKINDELQRLGTGWRIISAETIAIPSAEPDQFDLHYVTTVVVQKDE